MEFSKRSESQAMLSEMDGLRAKHNDLYNKFQEVNLNLEGAPSTFQ